MFDSGYKFEIPKHHKSIIKVIGVGGGGSNAVNHMFKQGIKDVEFVVCNTDAQALNSSPVPYKLQIGTNLTEGLGCGANPDVGRAAAIESREQIREMLSGTKMVFVTAGMGGGTGTGAAPVLAKIAKEMDILTVGIITVPFGWEGKKKFSQAQIGIDELRQNCDTVLMILNDKLREIYGNLPFPQAFAQADNVLTTAAKGIAEIITLTGHVNVDFQDVRTVMLNAGAAVMGTAETRGDNRAKKAAAAAIASPLLDNRDIMGAKRILLSIFSGPDAELLMDELSEITDFIQTQAGEDAEMIFGSGVDETLGDRIRVTIIATGFDVEARKQAKKDEAKKVHDLDRSQGWLFEAAKDNSMSNRIEPELKHKPLPPIEENNIHEREVVFTSNFSGVKNSFEDNFDDDGDDGLFRNEDEFDSRSQLYGDQTINDDGLMELRSTKDRLRQQAELRKSKLKEGKKSEMTKEEFSEKWALPAYMRRGVKMQDVPHSSEPFISKYNLNDDNNILGNNKFLHDNVD